MSKKNEIVQATLMTFEKQPLASPYIIAPFGELTRVMFKQSGSTIFPMKYFNKEKSLNQMLAAFNEDLANGKEKFTWDYTYEKDQVVYVKYEKVSGNCCSHFISGAQIECLMCHKFSGCRYCHAESADDHLFAPGRILCVECKEIQEFDEQKPNCVKCEKPLFKYACKYCGFISLNQEFFHSEEACHCVLGVASDYLYCEDCNNCYLKTEQKQHKVICRKDDLCPICQRKIDQMLFKKVQLQCKHDAHESCIKQHIANTQPENGEEPAQCPVCRLPVQLLSEYRIQRQKWLAKYSSEEVPAEFIGRFVEVMCLSCRVNHIDDKFIAQKHPLGYICPLCDSTNTSEGADYKHDDAVQRIEAQNKSIIERGGRIVFPLVLSKPEMPQLIDFFVKKFEPWWLECKGRMDPKEAETTELRELVEEMFMVRVIDEKLGFSALNLVHTRGFEGTATETMEEVIATYEEIRESRRLNLI